MILTRKRNNNRVRQKYHLVLKENKNQSISAEMTVFYPNLLRFPFVRAFSKTSKSICPTILLRKKNDYSPQTSTGKEGRFGWWKKRKESLSFFQFDSSRARIQPRRNETIKSLPPSLFLSLLSSSKRYRLKNSRQRPPCLHRFPLSALASLIPKKGKCTCM